MNIRLHDAIATALNDLERQSAENAKRLALEEVADRLKAADELYEAAVSTYATNAAGGWKRLHDAVEHYRDYLSDPKLLSLPDRTVKDIIDDVKKDHDEKNSPMVIGLLNEILAAHEREIEYIKRSLKGE